MEQLGQPLVVTAVLDPAAQALLDALREAHFPPARNHLSAHLTLFHAIPSGQRAALLQRIAEEARRPPIAARLAGLRSLGGGVAVVVAAPELVGLRRRLATALAPHLTAQDRRPLWPHVTIANKLPPPAARRLLAELQATWTPRPAAVEALAWWRYEGPTWAADGALPLAAPPTGVAGTP